MTHPHEKIIEKMTTSELINILADSKENYIKNNLTEHLHTSQLKLLKQITKHQKPQHQKQRIKKYEKTKNNKTQHQKTHEKLHLKRYKKLEQKQIITINTQTDKLPYEITLTDKGKKINKEIKKLEKQWEQEIQENNPEELQKQLIPISKKAQIINYKIEKTKKHVY